MASGGMSALWFVAVIAMIPLALWLLKRTSLGRGAGSAGVMRQVGSLPLSPSQRVVTIEVGEGEDKRWLVLGVSPQSITTLHTMDAQEAQADALASITPFAQLLTRLQVPMRKGVANGD
jgi:flagellar protein FliO/FliZ